MGGWRRGRYVDIERSLGEGRELVMVSNRLPVDRVTGPNGETTWSTSPGGLVAAVEPIVRSLGCRWVGWAGEAGEEIAPFEAGGMQLEPVALDAGDVQQFYEGFSNATLWPLYHDVIAAPEFHRLWWERYRTVNRRFAARAASVAPQGATVWVHDYQLQLVPAILRELRPDLSISFFLHIPFPPRQLFAQLPWRREIVRGMLGADVVGFQRDSDAASFREVARRYADARSRGDLVFVADEDGGEQRSVVVDDFPISIDFTGLAELAELPSVRARAEQIRAELGDPAVLFLGVDRLDYTKGIRHRLKAFDELLADGELDPADTVLLQVASPSRERVEAYRRLRGQVESTAGRINGAHGEIGRTPLVYLHHSYDREEMAALYLAADVMLVTPLRDGMNLVAKEYVASRGDKDGVLVLSEFTGAADELRDAIRVNPHDIEGLKAAIVRAAHMPREERARRMRSLRRVVRKNDVACWAESVLGAIRRVDADATPSSSTGAEVMRGEGEIRASGRPGHEASAPRGGQGELAARGAHSAASDTPGSQPEPELPGSLRARLHELASMPRLVVAVDFDGTLAPIVPRPEDARVLPRAQEALERLGGSPGTLVAVLSGRSLSSLDDTGFHTADWLVVGSHGAELRGFPGEDEAILRTGVTPLSRAETGLIARVRTRLERVFSDDRGVRLESKPFGIGVHSRGVASPRRSREILAAAGEIGAAEGMHVREGKRVRELSLRDADKGSAIRHIQDLAPGAPILFFGDDVTDEDAFAVLGPADLGVKVGAGASRASERIAGPEEVSEALHMLAELRGGGE